MSGNVSLHAVDSVATLTNGKVKWIPLKTTSDGELLVSIASGAGVDSTNNNFIFEEQNDHEEVAASQTDQVLGVTGAAGDVLTRLIITVTTAASAAVSIKDGSGSSIPILPNSPGNGVGVYVVPIGAVSSSGAWKVTTGAGSTVMAIGRFTA